MEGEKKKGGIVETVKDVAAEALKTAATAATAVVATRAAEGVQRGSPKEENQRSRREKKLRGGRNYLAPSSRQRRRAQEKRPAGIKRRVARKLRGRNVEFSFGNS